MADTVDVLVKKSEGWKEVISSGGGFFSASKSCQYCFAQSKPSVFFYGHRLNTTEIQLYLLPEFDKMYVKADQDLTVVVSGFSPDELQRTFIKLNGTDEYYTIQNPVTYDGSSVTIKFDLVFTQSETSQYIFDSDASGVNRMWAFISGDHILSVAVPFTGTRDGVSVDLGAVGAILDDGALHRYTLTLTTTKTIGRLGARFSERFNNLEALGNIIANVDLGNGNAWKLDRATGNTEPAAGGGNDLTYVNIDADARELFTFIDGRWVGVDIGGISSLNLSSFGTIAAVQDLLIGAKYKVIISASADATGKLGIIFNGAYDGSKDLEPGQTTEFEFINTATNLSYQGRGSFVGDATIDMRRIIEVA